MPKMNVFDDVVIPLGERPVLSAEAQALVDRVEVWQGPFVHEDLLARLESRCSSTVEQGFRKPQAAGSSPASGSIFGMPVLVVPGVDPNACVLVAVDGEKRMVGGTALRNLGD